MQNQSGYNTWVLLSQKYYLVFYFVLFFCFFFFHLFVLHSSALYIEISGMLLSLEL